jgi:hypothetical protein
MVSNDVAVLFALCSVVVPKITSVIVREIIHS